MEKLTLSNIEHAFYQSGELVGTALAFEKNICELKELIERYQTGDQTFELVSCILQSLGSMVVRTEKEAAQKRQEFTKSINQALRLRKAETPLHLKVKRAVKAFMAELEG